MISIYITCKDEEEAKKIAANLVKERLVACANIFPVKSIFWWRSEVTEAEEFAVFMKTKKENFDKVKEKIKELHSYDVPAIMAFNIVEKDNDYFDWLKEEIK